MSIAGLSSIDALRRLKEAIGVLARVKRPHVKNTLVALQEITINPISTSSEENSLERTDK